MDINKKWYKIEVLNKPQNNITRPFIDCRPLFTITIFLIPGVECPIRGAGLTHA